MSPNTDMFWSISVPVIRKSEKKLFPKEKCTAKQKKIEKFPKKNSEAKQKSHPLLAEQIYKSVNDQ